MSDTPEQDPLLEAEIDRLRADLAEARAAIARVRALHSNNVRHYECSECCFEYPCDTIVVLDGDV